MENNEAEYIFVILHVEKNQRHCGKAKKLLDSFIGT